jgi:hypothetical protein
MTKDKRLDEIEVQLTPEQLAIRLADRIREFPSLEDFLKHMLKDSYQQSPFMTPFYSLEKQAKETWPQDARKERERSAELRTEFQALKMLLTQTIREVGRMIVANRQRAQLQASKINTLILKGSFALIGLPEMLSETSLDSARLRLCSLLDDWANRSTALFKDLIAHKAAVETIQKDYFGSHPILPKDVEAALDATSQDVRELIAEFNDYRKDNAEWTKQSCDRKKEKTEIASDVHLKGENGLPIDVEAIEKCDETSVQSIVDKWISHARVSGIGYRLEQTGEHYDFFWEHFRTEMGMKS